MATQLGASGACWPLPPPPRGGASDGKQQSVTSSLVISTLSPPGPTPPLAGLGRSPPAPPLAQLALEGSNGNKAGAPK
eukprot:CAMPEP_0180781732 /NCGR_PEP_ID=MMETSP1038_2-20121128/47856_1 /TAXON_ID=632150 /ORGANISM="Azadinium spinosum, Strain 3D9" /LENGTH=77 /DNA_ID=CAMNT_0022817671 /DNA_START=84 /DNA_END=314 /DNA_ORIENTATION=-